jgi:peptidoglycan/xylan/chitin deacetylase (PgdA/CDA1 family)
MPSATVPPSQRATDGTPGSVTRRGALATRCARRPPVIMYHGVGSAPDDPLGLLLPPRLFRTHMRVLAAMGLRGVSLSELGDAMSQGRADGLVGLTFDDGYRDVLRWAVPVLERHGFTSTVFAVSGLLGGENVWDPLPRRRLMSASDLRDLVAGGMEIGSHSETHARLTDLSRRRLHEEVTRSRATLADATGVEPRSFCYPYGSVGAREVSAVREAGYPYACAVRRVPGLPTRWAMPRVGVTGLDWSLRFAAKLFVRGR